MNKDDKPPILRIKTKSGAVYYPRFHKNTQGEWELNDKSFREIFMHQSPSEKPAKEEKE